MPFVTVPGLTGKLYVPEQTAGARKKHPCPDCFSCQQCSEARCHVCRSEKSRAAPKGIKIQETMDNPGGGTLKKRADAAD